MEEVSIANNNFSRSTSELPRSISSTSGNEFRLTQHSPSATSPNGTRSGPSPPVPHAANLPRALQSPSAREVSITSNPGYLPNSGPGEVATTRSPYQIKRVPLRLSQEGSESQEDDHNFSDLLNLSVCLPNLNHQLPTQAQDLHQYSVVNSITSSDISSLANLGTPDSPPRATSPTGELRELLDKIQQLPQQKSPTQPPDTSSNYQVKDDRSL